MNPLIVILCVAIVSPLTHAAFPSYSWYTPFLPDDCGVIEPAIPVITDEDDCVRNIPTHTAPDMPSNCRPMCIVCYEWCRLGDVENVHPTFIVPENDANSAQCDCYGGVVPPPIKTASAHRAGFSMILHLVLLLLLPLSVYAQEGDGNTGDNLLDPIHPYAPSAIKATKYWAELNECTESYNPPGCYAS